MYTPIHIFFHPRYDVLLYTSYVTVRTVHACRAGSPQPMAAADMFDSARGWAALPPMLTPRASPATCAIGSTLYVFGGSHYHTDFPQLQPLGSAEMLDLAATSLKRGGGGGGGGRWRRCSAAHFLAVGAAAPIQQDESSSSRCPIPREGGVRHCRRVQWRC